MSRAITLTQDQLDAAARIYDRCTEWRSQDRVLHALREAFPDLRDVEGNLCKALTLNRFYRTHLSDAELDQMSAHIAGLKIDRSTFADDLVEQVGSMPQSRNQISFASKFCNFYCDLDRFPILDSRAGMALLIHMNGEIVTTSGYRYAAFVADLHRLRSQNAFIASCRELDHYLYLFGSYVLWEKKKKMIHPEVSALFEGHLRVADRDVTALLPRHYDEIPWPRRPKYV